MSFFHRSRPKQEVSLTPLVENQLSVPVETVPETVSAPQISQGVTSQSTHGTSAYDSPSFKVMNRKLTGDLSQDRRSNYEVSESGFSALTRNSVSAKNLRYAKFTLGGFAGLKHALFVPETVQLTPGVLEKALSYLGKEMPSMLIAGVGPRRTSSGLFCRTLARSGEFQGLIREAKLSLGLDAEEATAPASPRLQVDSVATAATAAAKAAASAAATVEAMVTPLLESCRPAGDNQPASGKELSEEVVKSSSNVFETYVLSRVHAVSSAAFQANAWTLTGPRTTELERFLELDATTPSGMCHLVIGHVQDKAYMESEISKNLMKELFKSAIPLTASAVRKVPPCALSGDLWNPRGRHRSTSGEADNVSAAPSAPWLWPLGEIFLLFYNEDIFDNETTGEPNWAYSTQNKFDEKAIPFRSDLLAPLAHLFIGANSRATKKQLLQAMKIPTPLLLLDHTSMLLRQASLLCNVLDRIYSPAPLTALGPLLSPGASAKLGASPSIPQLVQEIQPWKVLELMEKDFDTSAMEAKERFELPDIVALFERVQQQPSAYRTVFCVVDPLHKSPSDAVPSLVTLFNSRRPSAERSAGMPWQRSRAMVLKAWRLHRKLAQCGMQLRFQEILTVTASGLTMLLSVACASYMLFMRLQKTPPDQQIGDVAIPMPGGGSLRLMYDAADFMSFLALCLPVLTMLTGLLSFQSHWQISHKWSRVHVATTEVESEIYNFIGRVGPYAQVKGGSLRRFRRRLEGRVKQLSFVGVQEDDLGTVDDDFPASVEALAEHVDIYIYGAWGGSICLRRLRDLLVACEVPGRQHLQMVPDHEIVDLAAETDPQRYAQVRLNRLRGYYQSWLRTLVVRRMVLNVILVIVLAGTVVYLFSCRFCGMDIVATGRCLCIPVAVATASLCVTLLNTVASQVLIATLGKALKVLDGADLRLKAAKSSERKSEVMLAYLVAATERIAQAVARAFSEATFAEADEEDGDDSDTEKAAEKQTPRGDTCIDLEVRSSMSSAYGV